MITFIKNFKQIIQRQYQVIILAFISVLAMILSVEGKMNAVDTILAFLPIALVIFAVYVLETQYKTLVSHLVLFFFVFADYLGSFIRTLLSYNFDMNTFAVPITWQMILGLIVSVYLILIILSYLLTEGMHFKYVKSEVLVPMILVFIYLYLRYGIAVSTSTMIPIVIVFFVNAPLAVVALLLSLLITIPIDVIDLLISGAAEYASVFYWVITLFAFYLIYLLVKETLKLLRHHKTIE